MKRITFGLGASLPALCLSAGMALAQTPPTPAPILKQPAAGPASPSAPPGAQAPQPGAPQAAPSQASAPQSQGTQAQPSQSQPSQGASSGTAGQDPMTAQSGPPEGMVIETPSGFYLVRPGESTPRRLDMGPQGMRGGPGMGGPGMGGPGMGGQGMGGQGMGGPGMRGRGMGGPGMGGPGMEGRGMGGRGMGGPEAGRHMGEGPGMGRGQQPGDEGMDDGGEDGMQPPHHADAMAPDGKGARFSVKTPNLTLDMKCPDDEPIKSCVDAVTQLLDKTNAQGH